MFFEELKQLQSKFEQSRDIDSKPKNIDNINQQYSNVTIQQIKLNIICHQNIKILMFTKRKEEK